jgi:glycosyltransferase involved in cell wall biosynthesis
MKVLMLGWEFPPFISGGLGTACYGLTKAMSGLGIDVFFVLPKPIPAEHSSHVRLVTPKPGSPLAASEEIFESKEFKHVKFRTIRSSLQPYQDPRVYGQVSTLKATAAQTGPVVQPTETAVPISSNGSTQHATPGFLGPGQHYAGDLYAEVERYARLVTQIAAQEDFDVIHAHDWMTYPAGLAVAAISGKPLIVHVHSTEFDRSGEQVNQRIYDIERQGMHGASKAIAVSHLTARIITSRYNVPESKVRVIYNAIDTNGHKHPPEHARIRKDERIVLFLGRITMQKGPEYFLAAAKKVLDVMDNVRFVMAGSGDMIRRVIELAAEMGIGHKVLFTGFLRGEDVQQIYRMADVYVMPSVSEPFGIAPLEALSHDVPVIVSKQSGVSEVLQHVLKVDFWDINEMANKIIAVLKHPPLHSTLREHGSFEIRKLSWADAASACLSVYQEVTGQRQPVGAV